MDSLIREFRTRNFTVRVTAEEETDLDLSFDEDGSVARDLDNGKLIAFVAKAAVLLDGEEIAVDYLGGCIYKSLDEFADHRAVGRENRKLARKGTEARCGSYFADMIHSVIEEARQEFARKQQLVCGLKLRAA